MRGHVTCRPNRGGEDVMRRDENLSITTTTKEYEKKYIMPKTIHLQECEESKLMSNEI